MRPVTSVSVDERGNRKGGGVMELTEENIKEIANLNSGQYVLLRNSKTVTVVPVCYLAGEIIKLKKRIAELEDNLNALQTKYEELVDDQHELLQDNASLDAELCSSGQHVAELEKELDWCKHAGRVMTELHDEKCKRITELQAMVIDKEVE